MSNVRDSITYLYKVILHMLKCRYNQSVDQSKLTAQENDNKNINRIMLIETDI